MTIALGVLCMCWQAHVCKSVLVMELLFWSDPKELLLLCQITVLPLGLDTVVTLQTKLFIPWSRTVFLPLSLLIAFKAVHVYFVPFHVVWHTVSEQVGVHCLAQGQNNRTCSWDSDVVSDRLFFGRLNTSQKCIFSSIYFKPFEPNPSTQILIKKWIIVYM